MDQTYYEALKKANSKGAVWWEWGDKLYYLGLLSAAFSFFSIPLIYRINDRNVVIPLAVLVVSLTVFFIAISMKRKSYSIGKSDGVDIDTYWKNNDQEDG